MESSGDASIADIHRGTVKATTMTLSLSFTAHTMFLVALVVRRSGVGEPVDNCSQ